MGLMMAIVWVPLLVALVWALRMFSQSAQQSARRRDEGDRGPAARDVARLAYARGELDRGRYLEILEDLERTERPASRR
jgi:uncharacterized membrane protein